MLHRPDYFKFGHISKSYGIKGELIIFSEFGRFSELKTPEVVFAEINKQLVPFFVLSMVFRNKRIIAGLEGIHTIDQANKLSNTPLYLPNTLLQELPIKNSDFNQLAGFTITDSIHGKIGTLKAILDFPAQSVMQIINADQKEILVPALKEFIVKIDTQNKNVEINTPTGLLEVYLK